MSRMSYCYSCGEELEAFSVLICLGCLGKECKQFQKLSSKMFEMELNAAISSDSSDAGQNISIINN